MNGFYIEQLGSHQGMAGLHHHHHQGMVGLHHHHHQGMLGFLAIGLSPITSQWENLLRHKLSENSGKQDIMWW